REVPASAVPGDQRVAPRPRRPYGRADKPRDGGDRRPYVVERLGPATAGSRPAVLRGRGDEPGGGQRLGQRGDVGPVVLGPPEAAMEEDHEGGPGRVRG